MSPAPIDPPASARTVVVTGASSGIGAALARGFANRGDRVAIGARRPDRLREVEDAIRESGGHVFSHPLDVTSLDSIERFFAATTDALGPIEVAVNNAGLSIPGWVHECDPEDLTREIAINLLGPMLVSRTVLPGMLEREHGDIVFIGSDNADNPRPQQSGYSAAKAGIKNFSRVLAMELEGTGVRVTHLRLGPTMSEFGLAWSQKTLTSVLESWQPFGLTRNMAYLETSTVADAVIHALDAPRTASFANIELQPTAPPRSAS
jgi:NADP-dependent 3-hydroxy acid dehydrogenase YdfG